MANPAIILHVNWTLKAVEHKPAFHQAMRPLAAAITKEPECQYFDVIESLTDPTLIRVVEIFAAERSWITEVSFRSDRCRIAY
jgi:quinol monooxygenase YgiN